MRRMVVAGLALVVWGCAASDSTAPTVSLVGSYSLKTVNGAALPFTTFDNGTERDILTADVLTLRSDGSYADVGTYQVSDNSGVRTTSLTEVGTYSNTNGAITFNDQTHGIVYQGSLSGTVLTEIVQQVTQVYQKN